MKKVTKVTAIALAAVISGMFLFGVNGSAYIDPSVMTYLIQAIAGVVIAVGAVVAIHFRRAKKKINEKLGIDENRNKEVETDEIVVDTADAEEKVEETVEEAAKKTAEEVAEESKSEN